MKIVKKNKLILTHCPNFYKIINFEFSEDDKITAKLIELYKEFIFSIDPEIPLELKKVEKIDEILNKYLEDYYFRKEIRRDLLSIKVSKSDNIMTALIEKIFELFDNYETGYTRNIYFARWI